MSYAFIKKSVGKNGANVAEDVKSIQLRLDRWIMENRLPNVAMLAVDGDCGPATKKAIGAFQKLYMGYNNPDCRVDPNGKTLDALFQSLVSKKASDAAYQDWLNAQTAASQPEAHEKQANWQLNATEVADIRKNWGENVLAWARLPPNGSESREFFAQKNTDVYATIFGWKSNQPNIACVARPNQRVQVLAMLRDDMPYWLQRSRGDQQMATILQYSQACAVRDYRQFIVNQKMCPPAAYNRLASISNDVIYQMFLGMFQLLAPVGIGGAPAGSAAISDATKTLMEGIKTGNWPWTPSSKRI